MLRRCDAATEIGEPGANYVSYIYGECRYLEQTDGDTGCSPPLEVQTWPACQRSVADYEYEGRPYPYRPLPNERGATAASFEGGWRLEVYSGASTVVIFANQEAVAMKALSLLRPQATDSAPALRSADLETPTPDRLAAPVAGATEGSLPCAT